MIRMTERLAAVQTALTVHDGAMALVRNDGLPIEAIEPAAGFLAALESQGFTVTAGTSDGLYIGPIQHSNSQCQKDGCECWCQACSRHNWRHDRDSKEPAR